MNRELKAIFDDLVRIMRKSPQPTELILDQFCYLAYLRSLEALLVEPSLAGLTAREWFLDQPARFRWTYWSKMSIFNGVEYLKDEVFPYLASLHRYPDVSDFFRDAKVESWVDFDVLNAIVATVDVVFTNPDFRTDDLGAAFDGLLESLAGRQFGGPEIQTPSELRSLMVELANPTLGDALFDPACGTGSLLVTAMNRMLHSADHASRNGALAVVERDVSGSDISRFMTRIATVNLLMHGVRHPNIKRIDILSSSEKSAGIADAHFDIILLDPPLGLTASREKRIDGMSSARGDLLFVETAMQLLKPGGVCVMIVPDGVLFSNTNSAQSLRAKLVDENHVLAVVSLPVGLFRPYASVNCSIIAFKRATSDRAGVTWFYALKPALKTSISHREKDSIDGESKRDLLTAWRAFALSEFSSPPGPEGNTLQGSETMLRAGWWTRQSTIAESDYSLWPPSYRPNIEDSRPHRGVVDVFEDVLAAQEAIKRGVKDLESALTNQIFNVTATSDAVRPLPLRDIATVVAGRRIEENDDSSGRPVIKIGNLTGSSARVSRYAGPVDNEQIVRSGDVLIATTGTIGAYRWTGEDALLGPNLCRVVANTDIVSLSFLKYALDHLTDSMRDAARGSYIKHLTRDHIERMQIPVPSLDAQSRFVALAEEADRLGALFVDGSLATKTLSKSTIARLFNISGRS